MFDARRMASGGFGLPFDRLRVNSLRVRDGIREATAQDRKRATA